MTTERDYQLETVGAILACRSAATTCHVCGEKPGHRYDPGCRIIGCERSACPRVIVDGTLRAGFAEWERARSEEKRLAKSPTR